MAGQPVWCPDEEAYGIVMCDKIGQWAGIPFLHGVWYGDGNGCVFAVWAYHHNISECCFLYEWFRDVFLADRYAMAGIGTVVLWSNQTE